VPSQPTLGTAARACSLSHPTRLHSRPPAPTPSSALRLIAACVAQCRATRRWPEHDCDASVWAGGAFDSARGCLPALCDALAPPAELAAVGGGRGGGGGAPPPPRRMVNSCLLTSSAPSAASPRAPAASPSNRFCVLLRPVLAMSLCREGHRRRRRSGGPFVTETTKTFHPSGCCCRQKNKFGARARKVC